MSQDFNQYEQPRYEYEQPARPQKSGCGKGCFILLIVLGVVVAVLVGVVIWVVNHISKGMSNDPVEIAKRLKDRYPTAEMPDTYQGRFAIKFAIGFEMDMLFFAKENADINEEGEVITGDVMILLTVKFDGMEADQLEDVMQSGANAGKVIEKRPYPIKVGEYEFEAYLQKLQKRRQGMQEIHTQILVPLGNSTLLVMQSDKDKVDEESLKKFLLSIAKDCPTAKKAEKKD